MSRMELFLWMALVAGVRPEYLYFSTPGDSVHPAGFYGSRINSSDGNFEDLFENGLNCVQYKTHTKTNLNIQSVSFDHVTKQALVSVYRDDHLTLVSKKLCQPDVTTSCSNSSTHVLFYEADLVFEKIGPFALHNGSVYFLLNRVEVLDVIVSQSDIELRRMEGCEEKYPVDGSTAFDVESCSKLISRLHTERFEDNQRMTSLGSLLVVGNKQPSFLTLLRHVTFTSSGTYASVEVILVLISPGGQRTTLDSQEVDTGFLTWNLHQLGDISYNDGLLCWSVVDRILCADWEPSSVELRNIRVLLSRGQATDVCKTAMQGQDLLSDVITGVAIRDKTGPVVYFGCATEPQAPAGSLGGAGLIDGSRIVALKSNSSVLFAGSMFYFETCDSDTAYVTDAVGKLAPTLVCILIISALTHTW
ncbi:hypothetical protein CAPTEDRAFT_214707 [Capitella teleta]|uniref:Sema domain-containing protein n=1 Tax=Capitella teleta TaxID=283909 RepID=R7TYM3_CAPTE|nr:hypothetical protein CAPTEDRAFT_214707 [Capitella teleta]|eukprot:ELT96070.1 hypothetical protein CAPTEDRAFT_214707 [Capitella teleta]